MPYDPLPHQVEDSDNLLKYEVSYLWADAGTGKTVTAMEAIRKGGFEKVIVICPKLAMSMWAAELKDHLGLTSKILRGKLRRGEGVYYADALVMSFGVARNLNRNTNGLNMYFQVGGYPADKPGNRTWEDRYKTVVIIDEAHNLKSKDAKQSVAILGNKFDYQHPLCVTYGANAVWQLTGTPVTRYYDDLWTQLHAGRAEILEHYGVRSYDQFVNKFCRTKLVKYGRGQPRRVVVGNTSHETMKKLLADCDVIQRRLSDVAADMPPITHRVVEPDYKNVPAGGVGKLSAPQLMAALSDENSELSSIRRKLGMAKVPAIVDYVKEYGMKPYLIGFWHIDVGNAFLEALDDPLVKMVSGATPTNERDLIREQFNGNQLNGIVGQMQAMNTSWNLQEASSHVIIAEELVSPAMLHQFYSRVYRRGQKNHVQVDHMTSLHQLDVALSNIRSIKAADNRKVGL